MVDTEGIHELVRPEESLESFVAEMNDQGKFYELFTAVEATGRKTNPELDLETIDDIDHFMLGWMRLLWEAHHYEAIQDDEGKLETDHTFRDVIFQQES